MATHGIHIDSDVVDYEMDYLWTGLTIFSDQRCGPKRDGHDYSLTTYDPRQAVCPF